MEYRGVKVVIELTRHSELHNTKLITGTTCGHRRGGVRVGADEGVGHAARLAEQRTGHFTWADQSVQVPLGLPTLHSCPWRQRCGSLWWWPQAGTLKDRLRVTCLGVREGRPHEGDGNRSVR